MMSKRIYNSRGYSVVELMIVTLLISLVLGGLYLTLSTGQDTWRTTNTYISLRESLRLTVDRISKELRESGSDSSSTMMVTITNAGGVNGSDIIRFSIPVLCQGSTSVVDASGDVANWGATLIWGTDATFDCATLDYDRIEYRIDSDNQLLRRVLDSGSTILRTDVFAQNVTDFQAALSADNNLVTLTITTTLSTDLNRQLTATRSIDVYLRNRG